MLEFLYKPLAVIGLVSLVFLSGYTYRGHKDAIETHAEMVRQATANAEKIAELENESNTRLQQIERDRDSINTKLVKIQHPDCKRIGVDFDRLYNQSLPGNTKPATAQAAPTFSDETHTIIDNDLTCRALLNEYTTCYDWATGMKH